MPIVTFVPSGKTIVVEKGALLFDVALRLGLPVASSCSAAFACGKCTMQILAGAEALSAQRDPERKLLTRDHKPLTDRVSCVVRIYGDCTVTTSYW